MIWCSLAYQKWLTQHKIIFPFWLTLEVDVGADGVEVVLDHGHALPETDDVVVTRQEVEALVVHLTEISILLSHTGPRCYKAEFLHFSW